MHKKILSDLISILQANHQTMVQQLHQFCAINTGTCNLLGLEKMHTLLMEAFKSVADDIQSYTLPDIYTIDMDGKESIQAVGKALFIRKRPQLKRRILLVGHMDTVYNANHPFQALTYINDNYVNGPGVADMKGGLIVMLHALNAFESTLFAAELGWDVFISSDEEIGSPASKAVFNDIAGNYQAALVYEPAMTSTGTLAKNRKGSGKLTVVAKGKSAHAGRAFDEGRNAICYLAEAICAIHALNGQKEGVTLNIGKIAGGEALNMVPDTAVAKIDVRISQTDDEYWVREQLFRIFNNLKRDDYTLTLHGDFSRPVKRIDTATTRLFERVTKIGLELGLTIDWKDSGGCCDGNNLANLGVPVLDTLGVRGGNIHSSDEYILLDSLVERACLTALLMSDLAKGGLELLQP